MIETELKLLTDNDVFRFILLPAMLKEGMVVAQAPHSRTLITAQYDTPRLDLFRQGMSLRVRWDITEGHPQHTQVCLKTPRHRNGMVSRNEYEAQQEDPRGPPDLETLRKEFPHVDVSPLQHKHLIPFFQIETRRRRYIVTDHLGFFGELVHDNLHYVVGRTRLAPHTELEIEPMLKACRFDPVDGEDLLVCNGMAEEERETRLTWFGDFLLAQGKGMVHHTTEGKAERGVRAMLGWLSATQDAALRSVFAYSSARQRGAWGKKQETLELTP